MYVREAFKIISMNYVISAFIRGNTSSNGDFKECGAFPMVSKPGTTVKFVGGGHLRF